MFDGPFLLCSLTLVVGSFALGGIEAYHWIVAAEPPESPQAARKRFLSDRSNLHFATTMAILSGGAALLAFVTAILRSLLDISPAMPAAVEVSVVAMVVAFLTQQATIARITRPFGFACTACGKIVFSDRPWRCGFCDAVNRPEQAWDASLLFRCPEPRCRRTPYSVYCPHCGHSLSLTDDSPGDDHAARHLDAAARPVPIPTPLEKERAERQHDLEMLRIEKELLKLKRQLERLGTNPESPSVQAEIEKLVSSCDDEIDRSIRLQQWCRAKCRSIDERDDLETEDKEKIRDAIEEAVFQAEQGAYQIRQQNKKR